MQELPAPADQRDSTDDQQHAPHDRGQGDQTRQHAVPYAAIKRNATAATTNMMLTFWPLVMSIAVPPRTTLAAAPPIPAAAPRASHLPVQFPTRSWYKDNY